MEVYDVPRLADMLCLSEKAVRLYLAQGRLIGRKVGKRWLVCEDALRAFLMPQNSQDSDYRLTMNRESHDKEA